MGLPKYSARWMHRFVGNKQLIRAYIVYIPSQEINILYISDLLTQETHFPT